MLDSPRGIQRNSYALRDLATINKRFVRDIMLVTFWWSQILGFLQKLGDLAGDALHAQILRDNVHDAWVDPSCGNWAAGVDKSSDKSVVQSWHAVPLPWSGWGGCCRPTRLQEEHG